MRHPTIAVVSSLALFLAACTGSDDGGSTAGTGGIGGSANTGGAAGRASTGGSGGSSQVVFTDLPGKIRFINFVSDGTMGVNLDLYWGTSIARSERVGTVEYGEITEYFTPRHTDSPVLEADEARFFLVPEGDVSGTPTSFLVQDDPTFTADTVLTIAMAASDNAFGDALTVGVRTIDEAELSTPPAGMAHVFGWSSAFQHIDGGDFVLVGADGLCSPERGASGGANLGVPALIPEGTTGLALFDANTEPPCSSGTVPVDELVEAGHSYVLLGEAETYDIAARRSLWLELGTEN